MAVFISSSGMYGSPRRATATTTTLQLALAAAGGLLLAPVAARGSPKHDMQQHEDDRVLGLPGQPNGVAFGMYGGYVTVDDHDSRALYILFIESAAGVGFSYSNTSSNLSVGDDKMGR